MVYIYIRRTLRRAKRGENFWTYNVVSKILICSAKKLACTGCAKNFTVYREKIILYVPEGHFFLACSGKVPFGGGKFPSQSPPMFRSDQSVFKGGVVSLFPPPGYIRAWMYTWYSGSTSCMACLSSLFHMQ